jgi:uncharacterized protein YutE (UPF0331/DUF86 family)
MRVSTDTAERIVEKAEFIETCLEILAERQSVGPDEYAERIEIRDVVERRFETMTQACVDIARMLLVEVGADSEVPDANAAVMRELAGVGVLAEETADTMAEACGLRNVLAHEYGSVVDDGMVYDALQDLTRYRDFLVEVREFLADDGAI